MGYDTSFSGEWKVEPPLSAEHVADLNAFAEQDHRGDSRCPGNYCQWIPSDDGKVIEYDDGEKFYDYVEWIEYLIETKFNPWGYTLNGTVEWDGEEQGDMGRIVITDNFVTTVEPKIVWPDPDPQPEITWPNE